MARCVRAIVANDEDTFASAEKRLHLNALGAWKHRKVLEPEVPDLPDGARVHLSSNCVP